MTGSSPPPDVSVVIPGYNRGDLLGRCLQSLRASEGVTWEATVVENGSPEDLSPIQQRFPEVRWIRLPQNVGYAAANNLGLEGARGRHVCYLNSDAELFPDTLSGLVRFLDGSPAAGAVTPCNVGPDGIPQPTLSPDHTLLMAWLRDSGFHLLFPSLPPFRGWSLPNFDFHRVQEVATAQTTCLLVRGKAHAVVGGMDPELFLFYNDVDYCRRLRAAGWKLFYVPHPRVVHLGSASVETAPWKERQLWRDRYRFFRKWYGMVGTLGVRSACCHRGITRVLAQVVTGRFGAVPAIWRLSRDLQRGLAETHNGV